MLTGCKVYGFKEGAQLVELLALPELLADAYYL
jgi:hypothetical protein